MTATEELRRLLDERGVEWMDDSYAQLWCTVWHGHDGKQWRMTENMSGMLTELKAWQATPEQAVEATLGRGECEVEYVSEWMGWHCKACDVLWQGLRDQRPHFCPNCGRKVRA